MSQVLMHPRLPSHPAWIAAVVLVAFIGTTVAVGLLSTVGFDHVLDAVQLAHDGAQPTPAGAVAALPRVEPPAGTRIPAATAVFAGRGTLDEESAPTF